MLMNIIVCVDNGLGMLFNRRRQSRDSELNKRVLQLAGSSTLWMNDYTARMFAGMDCSNIRTDALFMQLAAPGDWCFVEDPALLSDISGVEKLVLYRWNRSYPSDRKLPLDLSLYMPESVYEFSGSSHSCITEEVYRL